MSMEASPLPVLVPDAPTLLIAVQQGRLEALLQRVARLLLAPSVVEALVAAGAVEALVTESVEPFVEVVGLTQSDDALAAQLAAALGDQGNRSPAGARGAGEAMALVRRPDLRATAFLSDDLAARRVAEAHAIPAHSLAALLDLPSHPLTPSPFHPRAPAPPHPLTLTLDAATAALLEALVAHGVGASPDEVVRRAVRGLATALDVGPVDG